LKQLSAALMASALFAASCDRVFAPKDPNWNSAARTYQWPHGSVKIPPGFAHHCCEGLDSIQGRFVSPDKELVIYYDIGGFAGSYADPKDQSFKEQFVEGTRVWTAQHQTRHDAGVAQTRFAVTFPDAGCANFFLYSSRSGDAEVIAQIAASYHPGTRVDPGAPSSPCGCLRMKPSNRSANSSPRQ
jgi:hypothetical protein